MSCIALANQLAGIHDVKEIGVSIDKRSNRTLFVLQRSTNSQNNRFGVLEICKD